MGKLTLEDLHEMTRRNGEPKLRSGKQELLESIINQYI
jgi:xylose isomerase